MVSSDVWTEEQAAHYDGDELDDRTTAEALRPVIDLLERLADGGRALELAIGTGRVGLPLAARGVQVSGIELSEAMIAQLRAKPGADDIAVTSGDMSTVHVEGDFSLVYLVYNTIGNLKRQEEQVACFANAARHLRPGGRFLIEVGVPDLRRLPPGQLAAPFVVTDEYVGFDVYDPVHQLLASHHHRRNPDGTWRAESASFRYVWPAELDLMATMAGLRLESRWADFAGQPFTADSTAHVSVWRKPA